MFIASEEEKITKAAKIHDFSKALYFILFFLISKKTSIFLLNLSSISNKMYLEQWRTEVKKNKWAITKKELNTCII